MTMSESEPKQTLAPDKQGSVVMFGVGGTSLKKRTEKVVWWAVFTIFLVFALYVLAKNFLF